jgi:hypothetical protein
MSIHLRAGSSLPRITEIDYGVIESLSPHQLTRLLKTLLHLETRRHQIATSCSFVSLKIDVKDGGEDGRVEWSGDPAATNRIRNRLTIYQSKAQKRMGPADFARACLNTAKEMTEFSDVPTRVKHRLLEAVCKRGAYVFFCGSALNKDQKEAAIAEIKKTLIKEGVDNAENSEFEIVDGNQIADWCNDFLSAALLALEMSGRPAPIELRTWWEWLKLEKPQFNFYDDDLQGKIAMLTKSASQPGCEVRIIGLPFMGKSRFVLESLGQDDYLKNQVIYFDSDVSSPNEIGSLLTNCIERCLFGIVVIDNCSLELHKRLAKIVKQSGSLISLITIGSDPEEISGVDRIDIEPSPIVVKKILTQSYGSSLHSADFERIVDFAQGFPGMAVLLANAQLKNDTKYGEITDDAMLQRLLGSVGAENEAKSVIQACSLFKSIGFDDQVVAERLFVAEQFTGLDGEEFFGYAQDFCCRRIMQRVGSYAIVVPRPLALRLAGDWWKRCSLEKARKLVESDMPPRLMNAWADQTALLDYLPTVQKIADKLFEANGPFGRAEVLNTDSGSRLFRSFVTVTPISAIQGLSYAFNDLTQADLIKVGPGRRNLVWALEKLCFNRDTFGRAAPLLMRFAAAENETWHNNATGQFAQLFRIALPGTAAPLSDRLPVIDAALADPRYKTLGLLAIGEALRSGHFSRMSGSELQGSKPVQLDYQPKDLTEVYWYWHQCIDRLIPYLALVDELGDNARHQLAATMHGLLKHRLFDVVYECATAIQGYPGFWKEGYDQLTHSIQRLKADWTTSDIKLMSSTEKMLQPKDWASQIFAFVSEASFHSSSIDESGNHRDDSKIKAERFAEVCKRLWPEWFSSLSLLFAGKQNYGFDFGAELGKDFVDPKSFIHASLECLRSIPFDQANIAVLAGFLKGVGSEELRRDCLATIKDDDGLIGFYTPMLTLTRVEEADLSSLISLAKTGRIRSQQLQMLAYGSVLSHLPIPPLTDFLGKLTELPGGERIALDIVFMYCFGHPDRWLPCKSIMRSLLLSINVSATTVGDNSLDYYHWEQTVTQLLKFDDGVDEELVKHITDQIINSSSTESDVSWNRYANAFRPLLQLLLSDKYRYVSWSLIGPALLSDDYLLQMHMQMLLGDLFEPITDRKTNTLIDSMPVDFVLAWCSTDSRAAAFAARTIKVIEEHAGSHKLTVLARTILTKFGDDEQVLRSFSLNLGSVGGVGSMEPQYRAQISAIQELLSGTSPKLQEWAQKQIKSAEHEAEHARKRHEEFTGGIYDSS